MNALARTIATPARPALIDVFRLRCEARALLVANFRMTLHEAVDALQADAESSGLIDLIGQDAAQDIMGIAFAAIDLLPEPEEFDDIGELDELCEREIELKAAERVKRWEAADPRDNGSPLIDVFRYIISLDDVDYLKEWLKQHRDDAPELFKIWKGDRC